MSEKSYTESLRTRWRRWLGNKTRAGTPHYTTLLDSNWLAWVDRVFCDCDFEHHGLTWRSGRDEVKRAYSRAIESATAEHFRRLDSLYCADKAGL